MIIPIFDKVGCGRSSISRRLGWTARINLNRFKGFNG